MFILDPYRFAAPAVSGSPIISFGSGSGYYGSTYSVANGGAGKWQADGADIPGATASTFTMSPAYEGKAIRWLRSDGTASNVIEMWVPTDMGTNLFAWYDAADPAGRTEVNGLVSSLLDKGGGSQHINQATAANRPFVANNEIVFSGAQSLATSNNFPISAVARRFLYVAGRRTDPGVSAHTVFMGVESQSRAFAIDLNNPTSGKIVAYKWGGGVNDIEVGPARDNTVVVGFTCPTTNSISAVLNGVIIQTNTVSSSVVSAPLRMGVRPTQSGKSAIREAIVGVALTSDQETRLQGYLAWRSGVAGDLPDGHACKAAAPRIQ